MECKICKFYVKEIRDVETQVIAFISISKKGARVCCKRRKEISYSCGITDYNEYPVGCPHKSETDKVCIISGDEHTPAIGDYYKLINGNF